MAKKAAKKSTKPARTPKPTATPAIGGPTAPLTEDEKAQIWALREEGFSYRQISKETGRGLRTVTRVLAEDPARRQDLIRAHAEERSRLHQRLENTGLIGAIGVAEDITSVFEAHRKKRRKKFTDDDLYVLKYAPAALNALRNAAAGSTRATHILAQSAAERASDSLGVQAGPQTDVMSMTPEELIHMARRFGLPLPPALREIADRLPPTEESPP